MARKNKNKRFRIKSNSKIKSTPSDNVHNHFTEYSSDGLTVKKAVANSTVYNCVRLLSESVGQLDVVLKKNVNGRMTPVNEGREFDIFSNQINDFQHINDFMEWAVFNLALYGNCYAAIKRNDIGSVVEIIPFRNTQGVGVNMDTDERIYYTYSTKGGKSDITFNRNDILHIKLVGYNGYKGLSPISQSSNSITMSIDTEEQINKFFENGCKLSGVLSVEGGIPEEYFERLKSEWNQTYGGSKNSGKTVILEYGMKYDSISLPPVDAQTLEQRQFNKQDIAQIFRVPLAMLGDNTSKYSSVEQNTMSFMRTALMPYITKIEREINRYTPDGFKFSIDTRSFVRGDAKSEVEITELLITRGLISINEGRERIDMPPVVGGDVFAVSTNNLQFSTWDNLPKLQQQSINESVTGAANEN